jgi:hypothetical protein
MKEGTGWVAWEPGRSHSRPRGTGITAYLENGGTLEKARQMAAHASTRTTQLYDRREDRVTLDEVVPPTPCRFHRRTESVPTTDVGHMAVTIR